MLNDGGVPLDTFIRDVEIRNKYFTTIDNEPDIGRTKLKKELADEYYLSYKSIENIVYSDKKKSPIAPSEAGDVDGSN